MENKVLWEVFRNMLTKQILRAGIETLGLIEVGERLRHRTGLGMPAEYLQYEECQLYGHEVEAFLRRLGMEPVRADWWVLPWKISSSSSVRNPVAYMLEQWYGGTHAERVDLEVAARYCFQPNDRRFLIVAEATLRALRWRRVSIGVA